MLSFSPIFQVQFQHHDGYDGANHVDDGITEAELDAFHRTVGRLRELPVDDPVRLRAEQVAASFSRDGRHRRRNARKAGRAEIDATIVRATATGAEQRREDAPLVLPAQAVTAKQVESGSVVGSYLRPKRCYVCKAPFTEVHAFYHLLCPACAVENADRRETRTDLRGRRALLTGGRVKIGFQLALMMLRDGAELLVTSRFPRDTVRRFAAAPGSAEWLSRLTVIGIDLRDPRQVLGLCERLLAEGEPLDILVNNAAQTVRRGPDAYAPLAAGERRALTIRELRTSSDGAGGAVRGVLEAPGFSTGRGLAPSGSGQSLVTVNEAGLIPDTAPENSWSVRLGGLDPAELLETHLVNAIAPTLLCDRLLPLLLASPHARRYIVNVTAVEGRFAVRNKTAGHPQTNMAKAALNMLTRTSAEELAASRVYLSSVDTGWITDENPAPRKTRIAGTGFRTPLDIVDGAARVYHPIVQGEAGEPLSGVFLKDYRVAEW